MKLDLTETRYDRLAQIPGWKLDTLRQGRVLVAGAGALGNEILKNLALLGIGQVVIADFDTVEISNLSRSVLFRATDQGQPKSLVAATRLREINPDIRVLPIHGHVRWNIGLGLYRRMDIVLGGLDSVAARVDVNRMCWQAGVPWVDGGLDEAGGVVRVFCPPDGTCYECGLSNEDYRQMNLRYSCQHVPLSTEALDRMPTTPMMASVIAGWQVNEAVKLLHGEPAAISQGIYFQSRQNQFFVVNYPRREQCLAHDQLDLTELIQLDEATAAMSVGDLLMLLRERIGQDVVIELDREIVYAMSCPRCGARTAVLFPRFSLTHNDTLCPNCGQERHLHQTHWIDDERTVFDMSVRLSDLGIPPLHILMARTHTGTKPRQSWLFELTGDSESNFYKAFLG